MNILYVEDCEVTVMLLQLNLDRHCDVDGLSLDVASTVTEAIQIFNVEKHTAVLIDWNLPDGDGLDVARHIRSLHETLPFVFLSSALSENNFRAANEYHPTAFLEKGNGKEYIDTLVGLLQ